MTIGADGEERRSRIATLAYAYEAAELHDVALCNLCGHSSFVVISRRDRYGYPATTQGCLRCGLVFLSPRMTRQGYADFYRDVYRPLVSAYHGREINAQTVQADQRQYASELLQSIRGVIGNQHKTLLDVGGSTGVVSCTLGTAFDLECTVIDPSPAETMEATGLGIRAVSGFIEDYVPGHGERYDVITLCQTIDHLLDVDGTLRKTRGLISPHGVLFVDIVDFRSAYLRSGRVSDATKIDHPYYLTEDTTEAFLRRTGWVVTRKAYSGDALHVGYFCTPGESHADAIPKTSWVRQQWRELRRVMNACE